MDITYIHQHYRTPSSAGGSRPHQFARRLSRDGHNVTIVAAGSGPSEVDGYRVRWIPIDYDNTMGTVSRLKSFAFFMVRASIAAATIPADIVLASSTPLTVAVPGMVGARSQRVPFVFEVRDVWPLLPIALGLLPAPLQIPARILEMVAYQSSDHIITLSPGMRRQISEITRGKAITVIPNAADPEEYSVQRLSRDATRTGMGLAPQDVFVVYAGSLGFVYAAEWLADLAIEVTSRGGRFIAYGEGSGLDEARRRCAEAGIPALAVFPGTAPKADVMYAVAAADWAVSSVIDVKELEAASINKVFDAWGVGTPVVFNHAGWLADIAARFGAGIRVSKDSCHEVADTLFREAASNETRRRQSLNLARSNFDRENLYAQFRDVLISTAQSHRRH